VAAVFAFLMATSQQPEKYCRVFTRLIQGYRPHQQWRIAPPGALFAFSIFTASATTFFAASSEMVLVLMICAEQAAVIAVVIIKNKKILFMFFN